MSMDEYARHRGCSVARLSQYVKAGKLTPTEVQMRGRLEIRFFDPILADAEIVSKLGRRAKEPSEAPKARVGRPTRAQKAALHVLAVAKSEKPVERTAEAKTTKERKITSVAFDEQEWVEITKRRTMAELIKTEADSQTAQIKMLEGAKKLIDADQAEDIYTAMVSDARDAMENVAPFIRSKFPAIDEEIIQEIAEQHRQILSMLSRGKIAAT